MFLGRGSTQEEFKHRSVSPHSLISQLSSYTMGLKLIFTGGHISLVVAFKGPNVLLGLYKCNYSLTVKQELGAAAG